MAKRKLTQRKPGKRKSVKRKFRTESAWHVFSACQVMCQQDDFDDKVIAQWVTKASCHLYAICRRPRIRLDEKSVRSNRTSLRGSFLVQDMDSWVKVPFALPVPEDMSPIAVKCRFPYERAEIRRANDKIPLEVKPAVMMQILGSSLRNPDALRYLDLEVLYVGQAYGQAGSRTAIDRLREHSTLQQVYFTSTKMNPDKEIWIVLFALEPLHGLSIIGGADGEIETTDDEDTAHMLNILETDVDDQIYLNFSEAALIRHFQPKYNVAFKDTFPSPAHSTYSQCYDVDLNSLTLEINTEDMLARLYSAAVPARWIHFNQFLLHDPAKRKSMFDF